MKHERIDSEKQTEGLRGEGLGEWDRPVVVRRARIAWCPGCYTQLMNHRTLHQKPGMYCMVTNIT